MRIVDFDNYMTERGRCGMCKETVEMIQKQRKRGHVYKLSEMKSLAESFLESAHYSGNGAVPVIEIAQKCGFKVVWGSMKDIEMSGFVSVGKDNEERFGTDKVIGVNGDDEVGHQRFVIAHELGHYLFDYDMSDKPYFDTYFKNSHKSLKEQIANVFAANILMPAERFVLEFDENKSMKSNIEHWSEYFGVQEKAVIKRVAEVMTNGV